MHRRYSRLPDDHCTNGFVPRKDRPSRSTTYHPIRGSSQYIFPSTKIAKKNQPNSFHLPSDEPKEMREHLSYRDQTESRDDHYASNQTYSRPNRRDAPPPLEEITYPHCPPRFITSERRADFQCDDHTVQHFDNFWYPTQPMKEAECFPSFEDRYVKRAEFVSNPDPTYNRSCKQNQHSRKPQKYDPSISIKDSIVSPPRLSRQKNADRRNTNRGRTSHQNSISKFPTQTRHHHCRKTKLCMHPYIDYRIFKHRHVGNPSLGIHRLRLPVELLGLLDHSEYRGSFFYYILVLNPNIQQNANF
jgi:hypothetical protein